MSESTRSTAYHAGRHCSDSELLAATHSCSLCGFKGGRKVVLKIQASPDVFLLACPRCQGASASRMPTPEALGRYYQHYREDCLSKVTFYSPSRFARHILKLTGERWTQPVVHILDFGGGDGSLSIAIAELLLARGGQANRVEIHLIDYSQQPGVPPANTTIRRLRSLEEAKRERYELVLASSIMEHIPEPRSDFEALFAAMGVAGSCLYARTPWIGPLFRILERFGVAFDFTYPAHIHDLGKGFWEHLAQHLPIENSRIQLRQSRPSIVETNFRDAAFRTLAAYLLKAPWRLMPNRYDLVGGWEVLFEHV